MWMLVIPIALILKFVVSMVITCIFIENGKIVMLDKLSESVSHSFNIIELDVLFEWIISYTTITHPKTNQIKVRLMKYIKIYLNILS